MDVIHYQFTLYTLDNSNVLFILIGCNTLSIYIPICFYFNKIKSPSRVFAEIFTFQYVSILIHRPNSRFFSTLFPHFLLTSQSLQIFYHISFINSTKEKQNHLFFMFVEFCRCTGIFTLSEGDSLKIVGTE